MENKISVPYSSRHGLTLYNLATVQFLSHSSDSLSYCRLFQFFERRVSFPNFRSDVGAVPCRAEAKSRLFSALSAVAVRKTFYYDSRCFTSASCNSRGECASIIFARGIGFYFSNNRNSYSSRSPFSDIYFRRGRLLISRVAKCFFRPAHGLLIRISVTLRSSYLPGGIRYRIVDLHFVNVDRIRILQT